MNSQSFPYQGITVHTIIQDMSVVGSRQMNCRRSHGFIIKIKGCTEYQFQNTTWKLSEGQILFVPKDSSYSIRQITPGYSYVVNFHVPQASAQSMSRLSFPKSLDIVPYTEKMYRCWQKGNMYGALSCLYGLLEKTIPETDSYSSPREQKILKPVLAYLETHLTDPELTMDTLPALCGVSDSYLRRIFKKRYGITPSEYVTKERLNLACKQLISNENCSISQIAFAAGYRDALYFSRLFKKQMGVTPSDYRRFHTADFF